MSTSSPSCPRCGYDLSGEVASWGRSEPACCPLEITCSECGEEWACRDVLNPAYGRLAGFWEHEPRGRLPAAFVRTVGWLVLPFRFWRRVKLHHEVRPWRLVGWAIGLPLMFLVLAVVARAAFFVGLLLSGAESWGDPAFRYYAQNTVLLPFGSAPFMGWIQWNLDTLIVVLVLLMLPALAYPAVLLVLTTSRRVAKLRTAHIARAAAYALLAPIVLAIGEVGVSLAAVARVLLANANPGGTTVPSEQFLWAYLEVSEWVMSFAPVGVVFYAFWLGWYWNRAFGVGFRLHMAWLVWALLTVIAGILAVWGVLFYQTIP